MTGMNRQELVECILLAGFRLAGVVMGLLGVLDLLLNLVGTGYRFDPNYLADFLLQSVLQSVLLVGAGMILVGLSKPLARRLSKAADSPPGP